METVIQLAYGFIIGAFAGFFMAAIICGIIQEATNYSYNVNRIFCLLWLIFIALCMLASATLS